MALEPGTTFGNYRIGAVIGEGGMGQVYLATDTTLERKVAIKVLPDSFAQDADRIARFEREAKTLASLNHNNIAQIYGIEKGVVTAIVMELVEGPTLADRIAEGPLPPEEALRIARQIIDGLEAAHDKGIVHRDLKPANIKVTADGLVKILDFGIAKSITATGSSGAKSPTMMTPAVTEAGVIMGTAAYMSPEQARGKFVDQRTDIWAFGCVLYEMLTGQPVFMGEDVMIVMASILRDKSDLTSIPSTISPAVRHAIKLCLEKDPKKRLHHIGDVRLALAGVLESDVLPAESAQRSAPSRSWLKALPLALFVAALVGLLAWQLKPEAARPVVRFVHAIPEDRPLVLTGPPVIDIAPDGRRLLYTSAPGLVVREMDAVDDRVVPGTQESRIYQRFSPDGQSLAFFTNFGSDRRLMRMAIAGGVPVELTLLLDNPSVRGLSWQTDSSLLFAVAGQGIWRISGNGGEPELVVAIEADQDLLLPEILPGGEWVLFTLTEGTTSDMGRFERAEIVAQSLVSGERRSLLQGASHARYVPTGHLVYGSGSTLFAVGFDPETLAMTGGRVPVVQGVRRESNLGVLQYAFAADGTLIYVPGTAVDSGQATLALGNGQGQADALAVPAGAYGNPRVSPDGRWIAYEVQYDDGADIAVFEIGGTAAPRRLTFGGNNLLPAWSADGLRVAYQSTRAGGAGLWWRLADGTGPEESLTQAAADEAHTPDSFTPDGAHLAYSVSGNNSAIWLLALATQQSSLLIESPGPGASHAVFAPDGRWLAYQAWDTGNNEIFVQPFPPTGAKYQLPSRGDNHHPAWASDGHELYYIPQPTRFEKVEISTERGFGFGNPVILDLRPLRNMAPDLPRGYDVMPDGSGILGTMLGGGDREEADRIVVVQNWFDELERLVPVE